MEETRAGGVLTRMKNTIFALACALATGCASIGGNDCATDAYQLGQRDGRIGASPQADLYAARCSASIDRDRYLEGWRAGYSQRPIPLW